MSGVQVTSTVYRNGPFQDGFGARLGPLAPTYSTVGVRGLSIAQPAGHPERGATWLVLTVVASRPGVYHLNQLSISYRSGLRQRRASGNTDLCMLAYPAVDKTRMLAEVNDFQPGVTPSSRLDPLVAEYEGCLHGNPKS